ncbi:MAG: hypothetical protein K2N21_01110 [Rikenellaceae bacterium]|nr:hypothetical protein [Rikenellaceae bacterium]
MNKSISFSEANTSDFNTLHSSHRPALDAIYTAVPEVDPFLLACEAVRENEELFRKLEIQQDEVALEFHQRILDAMDRYAAHTEDPKRGIHDYREAERRMMMEVDSIIRLRENTLRDIFNRGIASMRAIEAMPDPDPEDGETFSAADATFPDDSSAEVAAEPTHGVVDPENMGF